MPRIPLSEPPGMIRHVSDAAPMRGAPDMSFGMETGRALSRLGERIADAGEKLGGAGMRYAGTRARFLEAEQATNDKLMATQARNWYKTLNAELSQRMAENPNEYEHFAEWARETDETYRNGVGAWTGRMSEQYRKEFESEMEGLRIENFKERSLIGIHAKVTNDYNLFQARFKDFADRGEETEVKRLLDEHRGSLISEQEYQQKLLDYRNLADFGAAKRAVEAGDAGIIAKLRERDADGAYVNFRHLETSRREQLLNRAVADDAGRRADENQALLDRLNGGDVISAEDIDRQFADRTSPEDVRQKNQQRAIVERFRRAREAEERQAAADERRERREQEHEAREERRERREAAAQERQLRRDEANLHEYRILSHEFPADPGRRQVEYAAMRNDILTRYAGDGETVKRLLTQKSWNYQYGARNLENRADRFYSRNPGYGGRWYSFLTDVYNDDAVLKASNYEMAKIHYDEFMRRNPDASARDIDAFLDKLQTDTNQAECDKLMEYWGSLRTPKLTRSGSLKIGSEKDGWRFKGGDPSDRNSWEKIGGGR